MSDYLVNAASKPAMRKVMQSVGIPTPTELARADGTYQQAFLEGQRVLVGHGAHATAREAVGAALATTGAALVGAEAGAGDDKLTFDAMVFDATGMTSASDLKALYDFFHPVARRLNRNARVVVLASQPETQETLAAAAAARAVEGFTRSFAKEIGKFGSTVNLIYVASGAESRVAGPLRFFLSDYSTFVDGQAITVTAKGKMPAELPLTQPLSGKTALVTGGARGIGAATAERLAAEGAHVVCLDIPQDEETLIETVGGFGGTALPLDITDTDAPRRIADFLNEKFGGVDIVVHNAGVTRDKTLANMPEHYWNMVLAINLEAILAVDAVLTDEQVINSDGRVICLCSIGGIAGNRGQTNYGATKAGLIGFVERRATMAADRGVTFNAVAPGFIETRMTAEMPFGVREGGRRLSSLGQGGTPRDVAEAITFLATPAAGGISGNVLRVCGQSLIGA
ncbi:3-oxoacyl-ACP reductase [Salinisphaera sp. Q1T1-3]|uniref:3-oxoacyl-ACP reductase n=1 Tax=Salinisphaera sp. Q1T1-3 TaxID=2321229 RepID=UPI000E713AB0|nr:3-oxoacyl-ACP reductase [Salinisphaera sp. Q1T1-3]RJS91961.1 3-oxoacyl-ACP reductase [Salinisphaera sp. Q1T1-3]